MPREPIVMANMRREIAVGFSTIAVLLMVLGVLVYRRATATIGTDNDVAAAPPVIRPIEARPRIVVAQDTPSMDQPGDVGPEAAARGDRLEQLPEHRGAPDPRQLCHL